MSSTTHAGTGVENEGLLFGFCASEPGQETEHAKQLTSLPNVLVAKVFGRPDFIVIREWADSIPSDPLLASFSSLRETYEVAGLCRSGTDTRLQQFRSFPFICLVFLKMSPHAPESSYLTLESDYLHQLEWYVAQIKGKSAPVVLAMSSLGWYEIIALVGCYEFRPVMDSLLRLTRDKATKAMPGDRLSSVAAPDIVSTLTFPGVLLDRAGVPSESTMDAGLRVLISCNRGSEDETLRLFRRAFPRPYEYDASIDFGFHDLTLSFETVESVRDYSTRLWNFRKSASSLVNWTATTISISYPVPPDDQSTRSSTTGGEDTRASELCLNVNFTSDEFAELKRQDLDAYTRLEQVVGRYNSYAVDHRVQENCRRLRPFLAEILSRFTFDRESARRPDETNWYLESPHFLAEQLELFEYGMNQTLWGSPLFFMQPGRGYSPWEVGVQRSLLAADYLVGELLAAAGVKWEGFVVAGYSGEYHRYHGGVLDLPWHCVDRPERWWGLFHEVGHEFGSAKKITTYDDVASILDREHVADFDETVWEVFAEIFAIEYGFGTANWPTYLQIGWRYLDASGHFCQNPERYAVRWLLVYEYVTQLSHPSGTINDLYVKFDEMVERIVSETRISRQLLRRQRRDAVSRAWKFRELLPVFRRVAGTHEPRDDGAEDRYWKLIRNGQPVDGGLSARALVIALLRESLRQAQGKLSPTQVGQDLAGELSSQQRMAVILSLWNASMSAPK